MKEPNLNVLNTSSSLTSVTICPGNTYSFNGTTYSSPGTYSAMLTSSNGCDSTATLNLSFTSLPTTNVSATICAGESYSLNGTIFSQSGTYSTTFQSIQGCDSIVMLNLSVQPINTSVNVIGTSLIAEQAGAAYEWINCDDLTVVGNQQSFTGNLNNNYAVIITLNNCSDTSDCYLVSDLSLQNKVNSNFFVYPVPSDDILYLLSPMATIGQQYILYDDAGRVIFKGAIEADKTIISLEKYAIGIYQLKVGNEGNVFKIIRQ